MKHSSMFVFVAIVCVQSVFCQKLQWKDISGNLQYEPEYLASTDGCILFSAREKGIFRSSDNGLTWVGSDSGLAFHDVINMQRGGQAHELYCCTRDGYIHRSIDDGRRWAPVSSMPVPGLALLRTANGVFYGWNDTLGVYRSVNEGTSWSKAYTVAFDYKRVAALHTDSAGRVFLGTSMDGIYRSTDSGRTWRHVQASTYRVDRFYFPSDDVLYAWVNDALKISTNNGETWNGAPMPGGATRIVYDGTILYALRRTGLSQSLDSGRTYKELAKYDANGFWVTPDHGLLLWRRTKLLAKVLVYGDDENPVLHWVKSCNSICASNDGLLHAVNNYNNQYFISCDAGRSWVSQPEFDNVRVYDLIRDGSGTLAGLFVPYKSTLRFGVKLSDASPWVYHEIDTSCGYRMMLYSPSDHVFDLLCGQAVYRTRDLGNTWTQLYLPEPDRLPYESIYTRGDSLVVAAAHFGIAATTDFGRTWAMDPQFGAQGGNAARLIEMDDNGCMYLIRAHSLVQSTNKGLKWGFSNLTWGSALSIGRDSSGKVILGTTGGLASRSLTTGLWTSHKDTLQQTEIISLCVSPVGRIFACTVEATFAADGPTRGNSTGIPIPAPVRDAELLHPYPNPTSGATSIPFVISGSARVNIAVYDMLGVRVATITEREYAPGTYSIPWNGFNDRGATVPAGCYLVRMYAGERSSSVLLSKLR